MIRNETEPQRTKRNDLPGGRKEKGLKHDIIKRRLVINHVRNHGTIAKTVKRQKGSPTSPATEITTRSYEEVNADTSISFGQSTRCRTETTQQRIAGQKYPEAKSTQQSFKLYSQKVKKTPPIFFACMRILETIKR